MATPFFRGLGRAWREFQGQPDRGIQRREVFHGATVNRLYESFRSSTAQIDAEIRARGRLLRARARDLNTNDEYVSNYRRISINNIVGHQGFELQPAVLDAGGKLDEDINRRISEAWSRWEKARVTVDGRHTWHSLLCLAITTRRIEGEAFIRIVRGWPFNEWGLAFEPIDNDLIDETHNRTGMAQANGTWVNEIRMGIEIDQFGRRVGYHVQDRPRSTYDGGHRPPYFVPAEDMIHLTRPLRFNQTRGFSELNPVMLTTHRRNNIDEAEEIATVVGASKMGVIQAREGAQLGEVSSDKKQEVESEPGTWIQLDPGWEAHTWDPDHPNPNLWQFMKYLLRRVAAGFGIGYNGMASDYEGVNFTSLRAGNQVDRDEWRMEHRWVDDFLLTPVYPIWMNAALLSRQLVLPSFDYTRYLACHWQPRGWESVQPLDDIQADERKIALGLGTRTQLAAERGGNFERNLKRLAQEEAMAKAAGVSVAGLKTAPQPSTPDVPAEPAAPAAGTDSNGKNGKGTRRAEFAREGDRF